MQVTSYTFTRELRLLTPAQFKSVFTKPIKASSAEITLLAIPNSEQHPRLGLTVAKRYVKKAHQRNKIKRIIRDNFRLHQHDLPAVDMACLIWKTQNSKNW